MKKYAFKIILFLLIAVNSIAQNGNISTTIPPYVIESGGKYGTLAKKKRLYNYAWNYYRSDDRGNLNFPRWKLYGFNYTDSTSAVTDAALLATWTRYIAPCLIEDFETLGTWSVTGDPIKARYFGDSLVLTQSISTSPDQFIARGFNMIGREDVTLYRADLDSTCLTQFAYGETGTGGLEEPIGFTTPSGYVLFYASDSTKIYAVEGSEITDPDSTTGDNLIASYTNSTTQNTVNLTQFTDVGAVNKMRFVFGQGSPYFSDLQTTPQLPLKKGWDFTYSGALVNNTVVPSANVGAFYNGYTTWPYVANEMYTNNPSTYSSLQYVQSIKTPPLNLVSRANAIDLGKTLYYFRRGYYDKTTVGYTKSINSWHFDEEDWYYPAGGKPFVAAMMLGLIGEAGANEQIILYGNNYSPTSFRKGTVTAYPNGQTSAEIATAASTFNLDLGDFYNSGMYSDFGVMYQKTPVPETQSYYQKSGSSYVLDGSGKRQFRTDAFTDVLFGITTNFYTEPTATYQAYVTEDHTVPESEWRPDVYWAIAQQYRHHDMIQIGMKARSNAYGHGGDITYFYNEGVKPYAIVSLHTEPYTVEGNGHEQREVGRAGLESYLTITAMGGTWGFETWQDGTNGETYVGRPESPYQSNPAQGSDLYGSSNSYARFETATAVVQGVKAAFSGITADNTMRYFHFSKYLDSFNNKEILSQGFYNNGKMGIYFVYPFHDPTDTTTITVRLGDTMVKTVELVGRRPVIFNWDIDGTVSPNNMSISYTNIDGNAVYVTGNIESRTP